jgi:hypothetical protein
MRIEEKLGRIERQDTVSPVLKVPRQCPLVLLVEVMQMIGINFCYISLKGCIIVKYIGRAILGRNFDVTIGRAACEASSATWNLGTNSAFALGPRKTTENIDRVYRSKDLPDAN